MTPKQRAILEDLSNHGAPVYLPHANGNSIRSLAARGWIEPAGVNFGKYADWRITEAGRRALKGDAA